MRTPAIDVAAAFRKSVAIILCVSCSPAVSWAQQVSIEPQRPQAFVIVRPYLAPEIPPVRLTDAVPVTDYIRNGTMYLTAHDAVALALANDIDIEVTRYTPYLAQWNLERAEAGGALPGVPSGASQAGSVASGQGVAGSQAAAGVSIAGANANANRNQNATISQIGPVTQNLDPSFQQATTFSHTSAPQPNLVQSQTPNLITSTHVYSAALQQGFLTGGGATLNYTDHYLQENSPTDLLNPSVAPNLSLQLQHNLLRGFGIAVNSRTITIAKMNLNITDLNFKSRVISLVAQVLNAYYGLIGDYEDLRAKRNAADFASTFFGNIKTQVDIGSAAPPDLINAEQQLVTSRQAVVDSETTLRQQELTLKSLISRRGIADPVFRDAHIVPVDKLSIPASEDLPPLDQMVKQALANRSDLTVLNANLKTSEVSALGTRNGLLPTLQAFANLSQAGLAGTPHSVQNGPFVQTPDPYFVGDIGNALGQVFRRNFPTESAGAFYQEALRNRQAQADFAVDQLQLRQSQLSTRKSLNQVQVEIMNNLVALQQARARYQAAERNTALQQDLFEAEQKKFSLGASIPSNVIQQQRDLIAAQAVQTSALVTYTTARVSLDQATGATLDTNNVSIAQVRDGTIKPGPPVDHVGNPPVRDR